MIFFPFLLIIIIIGESIFLSAEECDFDIIIPGMSTDHINRAKNCTLLNGKISISHLSDNFCDLKFPLLREVTKYVLLLFSSCGIRSLDILPNLTVIRGIELIHGYSLVIYNTAWKYLNLVSLRVNLGGDILVSLNSYLCNTANIDWNYLNDNFYRDFNKTQCHRKINVKSNRFICSNNCSLSCPQAIINGQKIRLCWSYNNCQSICHSNCTEKGVYCHVSKLNLCCNFECLGGCYGLDEFSCVSCRNFYFNGSCVSRCPSGYYRFDNRYCLSFNECVSKDLAIISQEKRCVPICPTGLYMSVTNESKAKYCLNSSSDSDITKKPCGVLFLKSQKDIDQVTGCFSAERVIIRLQVGGRDLFNKLNKAFKHLKIVTGFVQVMRSNRLESLSFLEPLIAIRGETGVGNNSVTLDISANNVLSQLWQPHPQFSMGAGSVRILANRLLCNKHILRFVEKIKLSPTQYDKALLEASNGDMAICTVVNLEITVTEIKSNYVKLTWFGHHSNVSYQILNSLTHYRPIISGSSNIYSNFSPFSLNGCASNTWTVVETDCSNIVTGHKLKFSSLWPSSEGSEFICVLSSLIPATLYQIYLEFRFTSQNSAAISNKVFVRTSSEMPSIPQMFEGVSLVKNQLRVSWSPPFHPNGEIVKYVLRYRLPRIAFESEYLYQEYCNSNINSGFSFTEISNKNVEQSLESSEPHTLCSSCDMCKKACFKSPEKVEDLLEITKFDNHIQSLIFVQRKTDRMIINSKAFGTPDNINITLNQSKRKHHSMINNTPKSTINRSVLVYKNKPRTINIDIPVTDQYQKKYFYIIEGLDYFTEYLLEIVACHDYPYLGNYTKDVKDKISAQLCSNEARTSVRTLANVQADSIPLLDNGKYFVMQSVKKGLNISWRIPLKVNGIVLFYRLRYRMYSAEASWNDQCVDSKKLNISTRSLTKNITMESTVLNLHQSGLYQFQLMVVSLAGNGSWSGVETFEFRNHDEYLMRVFFISASIILVIIVCSIVIAVSIWKNNKQYLLTTNMDYIYSGHDEWDIEVQDITLISPIGRGNFGMVYNGTLTKLDTPAKIFSESVHFPLKVAIKTITQPASCEDIKEFLSEASIMKEFLGYHLVHLFGIFSGNIQSDGGSLPLVVMEMMEKGDLRTYLHLVADESDKGVIEGQQCLLWAIQIADGMCYLGCKRFVHRDLAARNCLVDENLNIKIGDFGLTRSTNENYYYRKKGRAKMPVRWMAPESLTSAFFTTKSDVWAYGVVLYEIATLGGLPYSGMSHEEVIDYVKGGGKLDHEDLKLPSALLDVMVWCWSFEDAGRPSFMQLLEFLVPYVVNNDFKKVSFYHNGFLPFDRCSNCIGDSSKMCMGTNEESIAMDNFCIHVFRCSCTVSVSKCEACCESLRKCEGDNLLTLSVRDIINQQNNS